MFTRQVSSFLDFLPSYLFVLPLSSQLMARSFRNEGGCYQVETHPVDKTRGRGLAMSL
jgi:hypothetical protein